MWGLGGGGEGGGRGGRNGAVLCVSVEGKGGEVVGEEWVYGGAFGGAF